MTDMFQWWNQNFQQPSTGVYQGMGTPLPQGGMNDVPMPLSVPNPMDAWANQNQWFRPSGNQPNQGIAGIPNSVARPELMQPQMGQFSLMNPNPQMSPTGSPQVNVPPSVPQPQVAGTTSAPVPTAQPQSFGSDALNAPGVITNQQIQDMNNLMRQEQNLLQPQQSGSFLGNFFGELETQDILGLGLGAAQIGVGAYFQNQANDLQSRKVGVSERALNEEIARRDAINANARNF